MPPLALRTAIAQHNSSPLDSGALWCYAFHMIAKRHIPNALCWLRLALVLPVLAAWSLAPQSWHYPVLFGCFLMAAITDFLDGYLARKWNVVSVFGAMIDQITDKLVVVSVLVLIVADGQIAPYAPLIIILREIYVSGLREAMGTQHIAMPVSKLGKWKTASQMVAILSLLASRALVLPHGLSPTAMFGLFALGNALLWVAALLALLSAIQYTKAAIK